MGSMFAPHELASVIGFTIITFIILPGLGFIVKQLFTITHNTAELVSREEFQEQQRQLSRIEKQLSDWLAHDHVRRPEWDALAVEVHTNANRLTRTETWELRIQRMEQQIDRIERRFDAHYRAPPVTSE